MSSKSDKTTCKAQLRSLSAPKLQSALNVDVLAFVADAVICTDEDGRILVFNQVAEQSFDYRTSEVIGQRVEMLLPENQRAEHVRQVRNSRSGDGAPTASWAVVGKSGAGARTETSFLLRQWCLARRSKAGRS